MCAYAFVGRKALARESYYARASENTRAATVTMKRRFIVHLLVPTFLTISPHPLCYLANTYIYAYIYPNF